MRYFIFVLVAVIFPVGVRVRCKALSGMSSLHVYAMSDVSFFNPSHGFDGFALNWTRHHSAELGLRTSFYCRQKFDRVDAHLHRFQEDLEAFPTVVHRPDESVLLTFTECFHPLSSSWTCQPSTPSWVLTLCSLLLTSVWYVRCGIG